MVRTAIIQKTPVLTITIMISLILCASGVGHGSPSGSAAYAQQNTTAVLQELRSAEKQNQVELANIKNLTTSDLAASKDISSSSARFATQAAYTALSVFFLGLALVIFGLGLTSKATGRISKYFTLMVWSLTLPVLFLIATFQVGILTNIPLKISNSDQPFFLLSILMYIPTGIVLFLLVAQRKMKPAQTLALQPERPKDSISQLESISRLRQTGLITEDDYQKLKEKVIANL
ncbi:MAG: hypothetical protein ABI361_06760 [Nitrososphaera sp.]